MTIVLPITKVGSSDSIWISILKWFKERFIKHKNFHHQIFILLGALLDPFPFGSLMKVVVSSITTSFVKDLR